MDFDFYPDLNKKPQAPEAPAAHEAPAAPVQTGTPAGQYASQTQYSDPNDFFFGDQLRRNGQTDPKENEGPVEYNPVMLAALVGGVTIGSSIVSAIFAAISPSTAVYGFLSAITQIVLLAAAAVAGFMAYKNLKGSAIFLGSFFLSGTVASAMVQFLLSFIRGYTANTILNIGLLLISAGLIPVCIMAYEKIKDSDALPEFNFAEKLGLNLGEGNSLYNPVFIAAAIGAINLVMRLINGIWNHKLIMDYMGYYGDGYLRDTAIEMFVINLFSLILVVGAGLFMSGSIKKTLEFCGYFFVSNKISLALVTLFNIDHSGKIVLIIILSIIFVAIGTAASFAFTYLSEKDTKINIKLPKR